MKFKIVFSAAEKKNRHEAAARFVISRKPKPTRSLVLIHFPARNMTLSYYNDQFDLHCGDLVFVDGKLEGFRGHVVDVCYTFKIKLSDYKLDQWKLMHIGAQPVPPSLIRRWKEYFPHHKYDTNYGLSESTGPGCVHLGMENIHKVGAIGIPGYRWEVKVVDEQGNAVPQGEVGELCVKGPGVMTCYYNNPEATAEVLKDGWLYTGDMAMQDADGFYFLVDRKKDVVVSGGENIYPVQIEDFLRTNDKIKDVAVIGLPDKRLGEICGAVIELKPGAVCDEAEINDFCLALPRYKRPRKIIFAEIPRNATGKIEKPVLRKRYGAEHLVAQQNRS